MNHASSLVALALQTLAWSRAVSANQSCA